jgi:hypothetical protein
MVGELQLHGAIKELQRVGFDIKKQQKLPVIRVITDGLFSGCH